jgi:high-affinity nickel-transport protein
LLAGQLHPQGVFWTFVSKLNANFGLLGYFIIGVFAASWVVSIGIYKWRRLDLLEPERIES